MNFKVTIEYSGAPYEQYYYKCKRKNETNTTQETKNDNKACNSLKTEIKLIWNIKKLSMLIHFRKNNIFGVHHDS